MSDYHPISERGRMLQDEYLERRAKSQVARIPPSKPELGPHWSDHAAEMIERVRALKRVITVALMPDARDDQAAQGNRDDD